jgi:hypothetical protein
MHVSDMEIVRVHRHFRNIKEEERYTEELDYTLSTDAE